MGVPSLYRWLTQRYPEIKLRLSRDKDHLADNLYLDFNAIIHPCCNKELESMLDTDAILYKNLENYMDTVIKKIRPRKLLYISIDGVAPQAKLNQQRSRRFIHAKEVADQGNFYFKDDCGSEPVHHIRKIGEDLDNESLEAEKGVFDTNTITPGTEFMQRLDLFLQELISYKMSHNEHWSKFNVIYSNYKVPGEGEQKIMEYIRRHQDPSLRSVIYSPDADLIFLGISLFNYNVQILREEPPKPGSAAALNNEISDKELVLVDIEKLKSLLIKEFRGAIKVPFDSKKFLEDWVFLCFTVGNDFLPCTPCFEIRTNALEKITSILQTVYMRTRSFITDGKTLNYDVLKEFFAECALRENQYIVEKRNNLVNTRGRMNIPYDASTEIFMEHDNGKIKYYVEKMGIKSEEELLVACEKYIKGLEWVYRYYFYDIASWDWFYPYHFAPFMTDLARVSSISVNFSLGRPLRPFEQLLSVLPPLSKNLLPTCLHPIFNEFTEYYPTDFKIDMFQKCMEWQAIPILPFIRSSDLVKAFEKRQEGLAFSECERNIQGYPIFFSRQPKLIAKIYPLYTELKVADFVKLEEYVGRVYALNSFKAIDEEVDSYGFNYVNRVVRFSFDQRKAQSFKSKQ